VVENVATDPLTVAAAHGISAAQINQAFDDAEGLVNAELQAHGISGHLDIHGVEAAPGADGRSATGRMSFTRTGTGKPYTFETGQIQPILTAVTTAAIALIVVLAFIPFGSLLMGGYALVARRRFTDGPVTPIASKIMLGVAAYSVIVAAIWAATL